MLLYNWISYIEMQRAQIFSFVRKPENRKQSTIERKTGKGDPTVRQA